MAHQQGRKRPVKFRELEGRLQHIRQSGGSQLPEEGERSIQRAGGKKEFLGGRETLGTIVDREGAAVPDHSGQKEKKLSEKEKSSERRGSADAKSFHTKKKCVILNLVYYG